VAISLLQGTTRDLLLIGKTDETPIRENIAVKLQAMGETTMMASAAALPQMVNEARTMGKIIDGTCHARQAEMTLTASQLPTGTMPEAIAIRISGIISKIPAGRILETKIPDRTRATGGITTGTTGATGTRSATAVPITMETGTMPQPIGAIPILPLMVATTGRVTRGSRLKDRRDNRIMATTLRNSPPMRTMEVAGTQADGVSFRIRPNRMEITTKVLASSRLKDRRRMATTLRNSPAMRTTEIVETQADHISLHIRPNRMEMRTKVLASSRLKDRRDSRIMATTLRNSPSMRTTGIAETQADHISFHIRPNRMELEMTTKVLASNKLKDRRDNRIMATTLRNSPPMRTTEIAETQADHINLHIRPNRMEMTAKVLASSRLKDRKDSRIMVTTLRNSPPMRTTEIAETQADGIKFLVHLNRMEMAIKVLLSSRQEDRQDQPMTEVALRIPRSR
jgi:hypothetical protein